MNDPATGPRQLEKRATDRTGSTRHQHVRTGSERNFRRRLEGRQGRVIPPANNGLQK